MAFGMAQVDVKVKLACQDLSQKYIFCISQVKNDEKDISIAMQQLSSVNKTDVWCRHAYTHTTKGGWTKQKDVCKESANNNKNKEV